MAAWFLTPYATIEAVEELYGEKPRAAAVVGAAFLDSVLTTILLGRFRVGGTRDELFKPEGGRLSDTDMKAKLAYTLGILSNKAFNDVRSVAQIRNKFAHRLDVTSFDHELLKPLCHNLKLIETEVGPLVPSSTPGVSLRFFEPDLDEKLADPRERFILTIKIITNGLVNQAEADNQLKPTFPRELI